MCVSTRLENYMMGILRCFNCENKRRTKSCLLGSLLFWALWQVSPTKMLKQVNLDSSQFILKQGFHFEARIRLSGFRVALLKEFDTFDISSSIIRWKTITYAVALNPISSNHVYQIWTHRLHFGYCFNSSTLKMMKNNAKLDHYKDYNDKIILTQGTNIIISKTKIKRHLLLYI